ncbi:MAG: AAA family ATPase [Chloroflexota bacterium]
MKLKKIELDGFGKLVNQSYEFNPGLNLIYGRNEAGKSTLQRSIFAALYGFFDDGTITALKRSAMSAYEPWDAKASFGLKLAFEVEDGAQYRVERTFSQRADTTLFDLKNGKNVSSRYKSASNGRLFFAEELLGMPREVFENTSLVRQAELAALEKSASAISDTILRLSASASQESTASQALELLATTLKEQIGTPRSRNKPLPEAQRRLVDLRSDRTRLQTEHQMLANQMQELAQTDENFRQLQSDYEKAKYQNLLAQRLVAQQQRQAIEQADAEVERCQKIVSQYQVWSAFPPDAHPKLQRLTAQHEKAKNDARQAEQAAHNAQKHISILRKQINDLRKSINGTDVSIELPDIETKSAMSASTSFQSWLDTEFSFLKSAILANKVAFDINAHTLAGIKTIGHEGITKDRQELGMLASEAAQANQVVKQIQNAASQVGISEDRCEAILSEAQAKVTNLKSWQLFPAQLRDELLQLNAQYIPLRENLASKFEQTSAARITLAKLIAQIDEFKGQVASLENVRKIHQQEKPRIHEIASQLEALKQSADEARKHFTEIDLVYQNLKKEFDLEKQTIGPLEQLGVSGLTQLQQRWINSKQQMVSAQARFEQSKEAWLKVGMPVSEFQKLENAVKEIQSGARPTPKPRRGCRSLFMPKQVGAVNQTPTEFVIYSQVQPIYAEFTRQHDEIANNEIVLHQIETEIHEKLGHLIPDVIQENIFADLIQKLQIHQQKSSQVEQRKGSWDSSHAQLQQAENRFQQTHIRLENELQGFGLTGQNLEDLLDQFYKDCEKKEQLIKTESNLEHLQSQTAMLEQQWQQDQLQQQALTQVEEKIIKLLASAGIQAEPGQLKEGLKRFEEGLENHSKWRTAQAQLEQIQNRIAEFKTQLSNARSNAATQEGSLEKTRQILIKKYSGLLQNDFTDQNLAQIDADLEAHNSVSAGNDKAEGQLEQLQLQAQAIQRDLNDWVEAEETTNSLENEIIQSIHDAGIVTDQISITEALSRFEEAFHGFTNLHQAQRTYDSAIQAQQAVRKSLSKLESDIDGLEGKISGLSKQHPGWKSLTVSDKPEVYERNAQKLNEQVLQERDRLTRLQDTVNRGTKNLRHLAELDEEIELVSADVQRFNNFSQALELATNELTVATREFQKMFAPRLERIVENGLEQITAGRYRQVKIDPNSLNVQVLAPERNELVETPLLSTGTRDLIYLVLRMGIAQLMSNSGEKMPLLLDDPFVEFDSIRQKAALDYLNNLSDKAQIFLFTKDENVKNWFDASGLSKTRCKVIELK